MSAPLLILGASVRALASSALRAGFDPVAVDLFADDDLAASCPARRVDPAAYPADLPRIAAECPPGPWMYTGALENHPGVIDRIAADRPLWGVDGPTLRRVRDPIALADALRRARLPALDVALDPDGLPPDGTWLVKPIRSAAGAGIRPFLGSERGPTGSAYFQRFQPGKSGSALFVGENGSARLVGVTRQRIGRVGSPFGYLGSEGPIWPPVAMRAQLGRTGSTLAEAFGLRGLFGVDFVADGGIAWPTEVNPRYTASVEVIEYATGLALLREHARAFGAGVEGHGTCLDSDRRFACKVVVFADRDGTVPASHRWPRFDPTSPEPPPVADLPAPGSSFRAGQPVLTLLERAEDARDCRRRIARRLRGWREILAGWSTLDD
ncbi:ATP-grasp domain-containing protein [Tautonia plasticadhaerens]|uniref:ATP-grasp domain protein n=1 Tax=Tautonia plasticadhaerens TaxID=2527974 RepID=A0A518GZY1_9BACT|nr:ATP-grasp domain-containing protein [Tautonia plasticadhaerens]QDV34147.1 ATP-grasp domain protein [Tautonia plasticadhaerens]